MRLTNTVLRHRSARVYLRIAAAALFAVATSPAAAAPTPPELESAIDALFAEHAGADRPGCAVGVVRDGEPIVARGFGRASLESNLPITPITTFNLGSVGKQFTALAALLLEQSGRLDLDADVRRFVPELAPSEPSIRVRDLLVHTSGLRDEGTLALLAARAARDMDGLLALLARQRGLDFRPRHAPRVQPQRLLGARARPRARHRRAAGRPARARDLGGRSACARRGCTTGAGGRSRAAPSPT